MGGALLKGLICAGFDLRALIVIDPSPPESIRQIIDNNALEYYQLIDSVPKEICPEVIIFAIKPQIIADFMRSNLDFIRKCGVVCSLVAGKDFKFFASLLGEDYPVVRAMPNLAVGVQRGVSALIANAIARESKHYARCHDVLSCVSKTVDLKSEEDIDAVTALSGSGPAYVFFLVEMLIEAAISEGLSPSVADTLARTMVDGAAGLMLESSCSVRELRQQVTSTGGTTEAAINVLKAEGFKSLVGQAVKQATQRSRELRQ
jgi:pyrroline-5-carboxylate reductase